MKIKVKAHDKLIEYDQDVFNRTSRSVKAFRLDNGRECGVNKLQDYAKSKRIRLILCAPYTPCQNGLAEVINRLINNFTRAMMEDGKVPGKLWTEAVKAAVYILNRTSTLAYGHQVTPIQKFDQLLGDDDRAPPNLSNLRVYGCDAYEHEPEQRRVKGQKFGPRGMGKLVGYEGKNTYRI